MSSSLIGKEAISRVQMWQRQTTVPGEPQLRGSRFAQLVGFAIIEQLTQARTPEEIINIVEKAASNCLTELNVYYNGFGDERARASAKFDSHIDKLWLIRALISPQRAAEENLFDQLYGDLVEAEKKWSPELKDTSPSDIIAFFQNKYDSDWFPQEK